VFHTQVRIGAPLNITGLTDYAQEPYYSTAVGCCTTGKNPISVVKQKWKNACISGLVVKRLNGCEKSFNF
jgi:cell division protein FtsA